MFKDKDSKYKVPCLLSSKLDKSMTVHLKYVITRGKSDEIGM